MLGHSEASRKLHQFQAVNSLFGHLANTAQPCSCDRVWHRVHRQEGHNSPASVLRREELNLEEAIVSTSQQEAGGSLDCH